MSLRGLDAAVVGLADAPGCRLHGGQDHPLGRCAGPTGIGTVRGVSSPGARQWPRWADATLAAAITAGVIVELTSSDPAPPPQRYIWPLLMAGALVWRRRFPSSVLLFVSVALLGEQLAGYEIDTLATPAALFTACYSVGAHQALRPAIAALAGCLLLLAVNVRIEGLGFGEWAFPAFVGTILWGAGAGMRVRIEAAVAADARARQAEQEQVRAAALAVLEERSRIARELHDVVAHSVSVMVLQAGALRRMLGSDLAREVQVTSTIERAGREALTEMRRMLELLRDDTPDPVPLAPQPGLARLDELVESTRAAGVPVTVHVDGPQVELPPGLDLCAYRIVQESLTNVIRHAGAAAVEVDLRFLPGCLDVTVVDDGCGGPAGRPGGHGLPGMQERVALFGGRLDAGPRAGGGFAVRASIPVVTR